MRLIMIIFLAISCYEKMDAAGTLRAYLQLRLQGNYTKEEIEVFFSGEMKEDIAKMNDENFSRFRSINIKSVKDIKILSTNCKEYVCFLTYSFRYSKGVFDGDLVDKRDVEVAIKKVAKLELFDEKWKITAIDNTKSFVKFHKAIDIAQ